MMVSNEKVRCVALFSDLHTADGLIPQLCNFHFFFTTIQLVTIITLMGQKDGNEGKQWPVLALTTE